MHNFKIVIFDLDDTLYDTSGRLDDATPNFEEMKVFDGVHDILLSIKARKILLTRGNKENQEKKIDTLGLRADFDEIAIVPADEDKLEFFNRVKSDTEARYVAIVGDKRIAEIRYGNMMGFTTILLKQGKYKDLAPKDDLEIPTYEIQSFSEIVQYV